MKVKDLIAILEKFNPNLTVIIQNDQESDEFVYVSGAEDVMYDRDYGEVYYDDNKATKESKACVIIKSR